jgi:FkbM family methyltransferase
MAEHVGSSGCVVAIEADPRMHLSLERNVALNGLSRVRVVHAAAASGPGTLHLVGFDEEDTNWGISRIAGASNGNRSSFAVPACSIDDLLDELGVDAVDLAKIDIEGAEALALAGMSAGLQRGRYRRLLLELHPTQLDQLGTSAAAVIEGLLATGYRGWVIAHTAADVRRAAYASNQSGESFLRPLHWPATLDTWPHLILVWRKTPLFVAGAKKGEPGRTLNDL